MDATLELTRLTLDDLPERLRAKAAHIAQDEPGVADFMRKAAEVIKGWQGLPTHRRGHIGKGRDAEYVLCVRAEESWEKLIVACRRAKALQAETVIGMAYQAWERKQQAIRDAPEAAARAAALRADVERLEREEAESTEAA